ncbi:hypothetical protein [Pseudoalteromonas luteoviolacea]|uniref:hypothetical protein n=1 Tax=Pseudoalteromonas luteoviolacea TaxID=43657 RepID=UPI00126A2C2E|nr:hypothetical protein [Pseudoalteromonas luteoviolacea]
MQEKKVNCGKCDVLILRATFDKTGGFCMPCFMELNNGLRPTELDALKEKGLFEYFNRWNIFVKNGVPKIKRNLSVIDKLNHYLPVINASISGYLRFGKGSFDGHKNSELLVELKVSSEGELLEFLSEVERFNNELMNVTKK